MLVVGDLAELCRPGVVYSSNMFRYFCTRPEPYHTIARNTAYSMAPVRMLGGSVVDFLIFLAKEIRK